MKNTDLTSNYETDGEFWFRVSLSWLLSLAACRMKVRTGPLCRLYILDPTNDATMRQMWIRVPKVYGFLSWSSEAVPVLGRGVFFFLPLRDVEKHLRDSTVTEIHPLETHGS